MARTVALALALLVAIASADLYMHSLRGSNNRNREANGNTENNNRLFNSQNNNAGGYCWGPSMFFYVGSQLRIEWTAQHGCGAGNEKVHCELIVQYMVDPGIPGYEVRDGTTTDTIPADEIAYQTPATDDAYETFLYGMHESYYYYENCTTRERNKGIYTADQNVGNNAQSTRQNPGGNRRGFECQEERDYYPYWHPTPWKDIAVFTDQTANCEIYMSESQNVKEKHLCSLPQYNNEAACGVNGGSWESYPAWGIPAPECLPAMFSRDNHLGNVAAVGGDGSPVTAFYDWTIPNDVSPKAVLRLRYNISTADFDGWSIDSSSNNEAAPLRNDPYINVSPDEDQFGIFNVSLAVDTDQFFRTFQDRSHTFEIRKVPNGAGPVDGARIFNLNVRGKRGNIVQTYPATEYDFVPTDLSVRTGDWVHFQWTGCDTNPANNDGEGTASTDRSNMVQIGTLGHSTPMLNPDDFNSKWLFIDEEVRFRFANLDQTNCLTYAQLLEKHGAVNNNFEQDVQNCMKLNAAEPYFDGGLVQMNRAGSFHYMSSRNNNFSNRGQKASIHVTTLVPTWSIVVLSVGGALFASAIVLVILKVASSSNPTLASYFG